MISGRMFEIEAGNLMEELLQDTLHYILIPKETTKIINVYMHVSVLIH